MSEDPSSASPPGVLVGEHRQREIAIRYRKLFGATPATKPLKKADIEHGFALLNDALKRDQRRATINLVGGAVMVLIHELRPSTLDIDGWLAPENYIAQQIREVGLLLGDERWLNKQALMYFPDQHPAKGDWVAYQTYSNLTIQTADARTMFSMKAMALRGAHDKLDFQYLSEILNISTLDEALLVIRRYYRETSLDQRSLVKIGEALDELRTSGR